MPSSNGGRGGYKNKNSNNKDNAMIENLRGACPPHKRKDLDKLFKQMHGDEAKINAKIQEWWDEPPQPVQEESWESVNKKSVKKKPTGGGGGGDRRDRSSRGGGRDSGGRGGGGGKGGSRGGRGAGRDRKRDDRGRDRKNSSKTENGEKGEEDDPATTTTSKNEQQTPAVAPGVPTPAMNTPILKGAWGARVAAASVSPTESAAAIDTGTAPKQPEESAAATSGFHNDEQPASTGASTPASSPPETNPLTVDCISSSVQPRTGIPAVATNVASEPAAPAPPRPSGNVWATKGSAHLIKAEKVPPPQLVAPESISSPSFVDHQQHQPDSSLSESGLTLETGIPNWGNEPSSSIVPEPTVPEPPPASRSIEMLIPTPPEPSSPQEPKQPDPVIEEVIPEPRQIVAPASPAAQRVLNMGRWDTGGEDDADTIDFGFGSFGAVTSSDTIANDIVQQVVSKNETTTGPGVSPARPPPGLSIGGMPPMPASAVMVHELENKLESASINANKNSASEQPSSGSHSQTTSSTAPSSLPSGITQQSSGMNSYNQQQQLLQQQQHVMSGMYNYTAAAGSGFMQPVLAGMPQQQQPGKLHGAGINNHSQNGPPGSLQQQGLYGAQAPPGVQSSISNTNRGVDTTSGASPGDNTSAGGATATTTAGVPPGMPGAIPYANPALHYNAAAQHQFYAQQQGIGYNYGYGGHAQQFGGAIQGGFGYPQVMGQSQGYGGASHYDDQGHGGNSHHTGSGGYQNKSGGGSGGGYRGRNAHNNNQYQNQYNPQQHGGYGGQPYGMGYHGHAPGGMTDPYAGMQQQHQHQQHGGIHSGFQDDDHQKGRKGSRGGSNNPSLQQQFQQQQQQQGGVPQQLTGGPGQPFALQQQQQQQQGAAINSSAPSSGGWSNQAAGGGGWTGSAAQSGGWQG